MPNHLHTQPTLMKSVLVGFLLFFIAGYPAFVFALPSGGVVAAGDAAITQSGVDMSINQSSNKLIVNWNNFSIGAAESVQFSQPGVNSVALNRVVGQDPSLILGSLSANGQIFVVNPSGVYIGKSARVDVYGFLATTLGISNENFLNGTYKFSQDHQQALSYVVNIGDISATRYVGLLAPGVANQGKIVVADLGSVSLASGEAAVMDFTGNGLINFVVTEAVSGTVVGPDGEVMQNRITHSGLIRANGGQVLLTARDAGDVIGSVVNHSGIIQARTVVEKNGRILLSGGDQGVVTVSGTLDATGDDAGETGGTIEIDGQRVGLFETAHVDVSGFAGGGTARIGGDYQGGGTMPTAQATYVGKDVVITADAWTLGDGGTVVVWADDVARVYGTVSARGGAKGGDGGLVETSGKNGLEVLNTPDVSAPNGAGGQWLIDPNNITIGLAGTGAFNINTTNPFLTTNDGALLGVDLIFNALTGGNTVTITTGASGANGQNGDIFFNADLDYDGITSGTLNLRADGDIIFNNSIFDGDTLTLLDTLSLSLQTGTTGSFTVQTGQRIDTNGLFNLGANDGFIDIIAGNVNLLGTLDSGTAFTSIQNTAGPLGLGDATCGVASCTMILSGSDIQNITTASLQLGGSSTSGLFVDNLTVLNTQNIGQFSLTSAGDISFDNNSSVFSGRLDLTAGDNININATVETLGLGGLGLTALADFDFNSVGDFTVSSLGQVVSHNTQIKVFANAVDLQGILNAGTGTVDLTAFTGAITDGPGTSIIAGTADLTAFSGIGSSANPLNTNINILIAAITGAAAGSGININEVNDITLQSVTTVNGDIDVVSGGIITQVLVTPGGSGTVALSDATPPPPPPVDGNLLEEFTDPAC